VLGLNSECGKNRSPEGDICRGDLVYRENGKGAQPKAIVQGLSGHASLREELLKTWNGGFIRKVQERACEEER